MRRLRMLGGRDGSGADSAERRRFKRRPNENDEILPHLALESLWVDETFCSMQSIQSSPRGLHTHSWWRKQPHFRESQWQYGSSTIVRGTERVILSQIRFTAL
jgi:hypothetical protein